METTLRRIYRSIGFAAIVIAFFAAFPLAVAGRNELGRSQAAARWLSMFCRSLCRLLGIRIDMPEKWAETRLFVFNHVSYLDVMVLSAIAPVTFVAKSEVRAWPVFGWGARCAGTIFVDRSRRQAVDRPIREISEKNDAGISVVLFPEGTSSDGSRVMPFHSSLLESASRCYWPVTPGWIGYSLRDGDAGREAGWWGDMTLLPHLWNLFGHRSMEAWVRLGKPVADTNRKQLAVRLRESVMELSDTWRQAAMGQEHSAGGVRQDATDSTRRRRYA